MTGNDRGRPDATRAATLARLASESFDLLVVGGGATGAAIARDAALRGLSVALVDAGDFAGQTSSHSSKLIHGGLRYLQYGDLPLVFEGLRERRRLMSTAPHLCRPIEFVFPGYRGESPGLVTLGAGIALYNALALWRPPAASRHLDAHALYALSPHLRSAGLEGAQIYVDCQTDDARLVLENVLDAEAAGAAAANHLAVERIARDRRGRARGAAGRRRRDRRALRDPGAPGRQRDRPLHRRLPRRRAPPAPHAGRAPGVRRRAGPARRPRARAPHAAGQPPLLRPAGRARARSSGTTDTDFTPAEIARARPAGRRRDPRPRRRRHLSARGRAPRLPGARARPRRRRVDLRRPAPAPGRQRAHALRDLARARDLAHHRRNRRRRRRQADHARAGWRRRRSTWSSRRCAPPASNGHSPPARRATRPLPGAGPLPDGARRARASARRDDPSRRRLRHARRTRAGDRRRIAPARRAHRSGPPLSLGRDRPRGPPRARPRCSTDLLVRRVPLFRDAADQGLGVAPRAATLAARELGWDDARRDRELAGYRDAVAVSRRWRQELV